MEGVIPSYKVDELFSVKDKVPLITGMGGYGSVIAVEDKADVEQKVAEIAEKYGRIDILIHTVGIAPVWIYTPMMARRPGDYITQAAGTIPMGRISYSEDYVGMTLFLASDSSAYVTGQPFLVDGGWGAYKAFKYSAE